MSSRDMIDLLSEGEWLPSRSAGTLRPESTLSNQDVVYVYVVGTPRSTQRGMTSDALWDVLERLNNLLALPPNWDAYGAELVSPRVAKQVLGVLKDVLWADTPLPQFTATSDGGIQMEWYRPTMLLSITIEPDEQPHLYYRDNATSEYWEATLGQEPENLDKVFARMSLTP